VSRRGFSLLEVILSLAILGGAIATLGETARLAFRNAAYTRQAARAQLLCESKLSEIVSGLTPAEPVQRAVIEAAAAPGEPAWLYSVEKTPLDNEGLVALRVTVVRDLPAEKHPATFVLVRWISDSSTTDSEGSATAPESDSSGTSASRATL
jgi:prepilin-type N-terminal cleavage/methylation domain-containing protein